MMNNLKLSEKRSAQKRNHGIDLLRIISMIYVLILHTLGLGGILKSLTPGTRQYQVFWFMEIWSYCAVNIFVLISGYAGFTEEEKKTDWSGYLILWLEVVFYGIGIAVIYRLFHPHSVSNNTIRDMAFPLANNVYWFFSAYTGLFIVKPFLNVSIRHTDNKTLSRLIVIIFLTFSCYSVIADPFRLEGGYSFVWFLILYLIGAAIKKMGFTEKISSLQAISGIFLLILLSWIWKMCGVNFRIMNINFKPDLWITYTSPLTTMAATLHVILFARMNFSAAGSVISFLAPGSFAVYLINTHPSLWLSEFENRFSGWAGLHTADGLIHVMSFSVSFVVISLLIDKVRQVIFSGLKLRKIFFQLLYGPDRMAAVRTLSGPVYGILFIRIWGFLFWKCTYGYGNIDESMYLSLPYRVLKWEDRLLVHEWHQTQLQAFPLLPAFMVYDWLFHSTERIILNFRLLYTFLWGCSMLFFYFRTKKVSRPGAAAATLALLVYAPYGIMAFSYNSMGILFLLNAGIIGMTAEHHKKLQYIISGIFLAGAVLCCPYLLVLYGFFTATVWISYLRKHDPDQKTLWLCVTAGALIMFVLFAVFILSRADISQIIRSLPFIMDDAEHPQRSFFSKTVLYLSSVWHTVPVGPYFFIVSLLAIVISLIREKMMPSCFVILCISSMIWLLYCTFHRNHINYLMMPLCLPGLFAAVHSNNNTIRAVFRWIWMPGIIYTFCLNYSSNQGFYAITNAAAVAVFASFLMIAVFVQTEISSLKGQKTVLFVIAAMLFIVQMCCELSVRYKNVFWEIGIEDQTVYASEGPEKDIRMTHDHLSVYNSILREIRSVRENDDVKNVLFLTTDPVLYLCVEKSIGAFSSWLSAVDDHTVEKLDIYYEMNPEKIPDAIYIPANFEKYISHFEQMGYQTSRTRKGNFILMRDTVNSL